MPSSQTHDVTYVTIDIGANDLLGHLGSDDCSVDLDDPACRQRIDSSSDAYADNIDEVFRRLRRRGARRDHRASCGRTTPSASGSAPRSGSRRRATTPSTPSTTSQQRPPGAYSVLVADGFTPMVGTTASTTHMLDTPPDIHPKAIGYDVLAYAITLVIG